VNTYDGYVRALIHQFWDYAETESLAERGLLDSADRSSKRPPVFRKSFDFSNILIAPDADDEFRNAIISSLSDDEKHRHFASMRSSQALAQSVFGNLAVHGKLKLLDGLMSDKGLPAFGNGLDHASLQLEYNVSHLGEPRPTSIDVWIRSDHRVAVECKLTEPECGTCSRPRLKKGVDKNYDRAFCDGSYTRQRKRKTRCSLSEIGVEYWQYIPELFHWSNGEDLSPCALRNTYQLVRNVLAACVTPDGKVDASDSHALLIYDSRNPSFQKDGFADQQLAAARAALKKPDVLRSCTWQSLVEHLASSRELPWLTGQLRAKYGF